MKTEIETKRWLRFQAGGTPVFGALDGDTIVRYEGDMFGAATPTGQTFPLEDVKLLPPTEPTKMIGLWNNFAALARSSS